MGRAHWFLGAIVATVLGSAVLAVLPDSGDPVEVPGWTLPLLLLAVVVGYLYGKARAGSRA